ncbi:MAG: acetate--CoA ligase family protein [Myxococcota bacterium]|nr:acetate--CoA ligase family protein [Myxococcota bacterium]
MSKLPAMTTTQATTLSEAASKELLAGFGIRFARESRASNSEEAIAAAESIGFPVVLKLSGDGIAHKTERGLVVVGLADAQGVASAAETLLAKARPEDGAVELLVAEQVAGARELIAGLVRDPQFGACVVVGLGGILTEALEDVAFAATPLTRAQAEGLIEQLNASHLFTEPFRGEPALDRGALADLLLGLSQLAEARPEIASVDLNPLILCQGSPVAVDALVELGEPGVEPARRECPDPDALRERFDALFHPRGVVVAGVSSHPAKFGFVTLHNLQRFGFKGEIFPVKLDGAEVLGAPTLRDIESVPQGAADLVFVCTPTSGNAQLLRDCAAKGIRAAFIASAGYGEAGEEGRALQKELVETADELGMLLIGPNGQGVISTPAHMCAQIVSPFPPGGRIGVASQSGNLVSSYLNYAVATGVGVSKAISLGNSAQTGLADMLEYFAVDPDTDVALAYVEGVGEGRRFREAAARLTSEKPLVLVKGGATQQGARAASSHTGALASDDRVFDGICQQLGVLRAPTVEEAFEWAATLASQPLPRGPRTLVFTSVGGWGVLAADACAAHGLDLIALPDEIRSKIDTMVPARWSRNNPIDLASGETRDTIPEVIDLVTAHPDVDAVIHLGLGIQSGQAGVFRSGNFYPEHGLERIVGYHETQDTRFAVAAREASERYGKPVLSVSELAISDPSNAGPAAVRAGGRVCYPSAHRAVSALAALWSRARFQDAGA